ncbi:MarR family winged helix-turn-helix transcriptional regulator [Crenobacter cavernae]|uniref:MarR family transcriptional regulator n=1 Tax=Crenobacter cavernae TaxID=2290923 RepID=A0A345Y602_9NEIS|nr:MarR family transcriptional regulator [Crenobacter cavernae]AXK39354.1 MarR family transcriptional regulator [Crenobacter cavernae]
MPTATREPFLPVIRELVRTYQAFETFSNAHIRELGLTPPQFDVLATLGNTPGMTCKELSEQTLITKGTLTGVIDRLLDKGLVSRTAREEDRRSVFIALTDTGQALFDQIFPAHLAHMRQAFAGLDNDDFSRICAELAKLRRTIGLAMENYKP